jgi:hypothetical protein
MSEGKVIHPDEVQAVPNVHGGRAVIGIEVITVLDREPVEAGIRHGIVPGRIGQGFCKRIVQRVFQAA